MAARRKTTANSARKTTGRGRKPAAASKQKIDRRWSILLFGFGVLFIVLSLITGESGWAWMRSHFLFGVFGISGWLLGPFLLYLGVRVAREEPLLLPILKSLFVMASLSGLVLVFGKMEFAGDSFAQVISKLFTTGLDSAFGAGFFSMFLGYSLLTFCGRLVARVLLVLAFIGSVMLLTGVRPKHIAGVFHSLVDRIPQPPIQLEEELEYEEDEYTEPLVVPQSSRAYDAQAPRRSKKRIDIPLPDDVPVSTPGLGQMDSVDIPAGGTFGKKPLDELVEDATGQSRPEFPDIQENENDTLLFGVDDPLARLPGAGARRQVSVYDYEQESSQKDLFGRTDTVTPVQEFGEKDAAPSQNYLPEEPAVPQDLQLEPGDPSLEAMIDKAAAVKADSSPAMDTRDEDALFSQEYTYPPATLFGLPPADNTTGAREEMRKTADLLVGTLSSFGVETRILDVSRGPSVTRYEIQPQAGVKISRITNLADDIALNLAAAGVRIEAPIPGKPAVGIEVPNKTKSMVCIRSILESPVFTEASSPLSIALGKDIAGDCIVADLTKMPHLLVAGSTGSGKSVCINATIMSFVYKSSPEDVRLVLIDPKVVELAEYNGIPHLLMPVVTEPRKAAGALGAMVAEMEKRYRLFAENNVRDIKTFNKLVGRRMDLEKLPYIAIVIDELADLMMTAGKEVEDYICRIAQKARAAGMHLIVATQRPSVDVITGLIKANIPSRIAFSVSSQVDSRTILDGAGAEKLLGMGDMLFMPVGANKPVRVQGTYVKDKEITKVLDFIKGNGGVQYDEGMIEEMERRASTESSGTASEGDEGILKDETFISAVEMALEAGQVSTSHLQRRLRLGYARAGRIVDEMERLGIVSGPNGSKPREVQINRQQWQELLMNAAN